MATCADLTAQLGGDVHRRPLEGPALRRGGPPSSSTPGQARVNRSIGATWEQVSQEHRGRGRRTGKGVGTGRRAEADT